MSRNLALNVTLAVGSSLLLATALMVVCRGPQSEGVSGRGPVLSSAREAELEQSLQQRELEIDALRAEVNRLQNSIAKVRTPYEPPAAVTAEVPIAGDPTARPKPTTAIDGAVAFLRAALPDRFANLTTEQAAALTELDLRDAKVTDDALALVASLPSLQNLCLRGTEVTDAGLAHLRGMTQLAALDLRGTAITGAGVSQLPSLGLTALHLTDTHVTGDDLHWFPTMPNLRTLKVNRLTLGDAAIGDLALFPSVQHLEMDGTAISDVGLRQLLAQNPALQRIELRSTAVSPDAIRELRSAYPNVELVQDEGVAYRPYAR